MSDEAIPRFKIVILGNSGSGKTSLINRWVSSTFTANTKQTIGSNYELKRVPLDGGEVIDLYIWDTAGQERFHSLMPLYTRACDLAVITTAIDDLVSFQSISKWIDLVALACETLPPIVLAVNKHDLADKAAMTVEEIHASYDSQFTSIFFVSAKTGENCDPLVREMAAKATYFNRNVKLKEASTPAKEGGPGCC
jgi:small GTP-binding protein